MRTINTMTTPDGQRLFQCPNPRDVGDLGLQTTVVPASISDKILDVLHNRAKPLHPHDISFVKKFHIKPYRACNTFNRFLRRRNRDLLTDAVLEDLRTGRTCAADVVATLHVDLEDVEYHLHEKHHQTLDQVEQTRIQSATSAQEKQKAQLAHTRTHLERSKTKQVKVIKETCGQTSENRVTHYLKSHRLGPTSYETEDQQKQRPLDGQNGRTPDYLLKKPVCVNGQRVHWIDCKNAVMVPGACRDRELNRVLRQMNAYRDLFGPGLIIWNDVPPFETMIAFLGEADLLHLHLPKKKKPPVKTKGPKPRPRIAATLSFEAQCKARNDLLTHEQLARLMQLLEQRLKDELP